MSEQPSPLPVNNPPQRCGLALASLILGIIGIVLCFGPIAGIPAVICGHMAMSRIKKSAGGLSGNGLAVAGLITGYFAIAMIVVIGLLAAVAIPNFTKAYKVTQQNICIMNLKEIQGAKVQWALENKKKETDVPTDRDLFGPDKSVPQRPICPAGGTYDLRAAKDNPTCSIPGHQLNEQIKE